MTRYDELIKHMGHHFEVECRTGEGVAALVCTTCRQDVMLAPTSLDWTGVTLKAALEDLIEAFGSDRVAEMVAMLMDVYPLNRRT